MNDDNDLIVGQLQLAEFVRILMRSSVRAHNVGIKNEMNTNEI